jgi:flotillin
LADARAQQEVMAEQRLLAQKRAELREQELQAEVVKPAEAEAERVRILAQADADRTRIAAEAAASNNKIALDQQLIEQLPLLVSEAAKGLSGARLTVLNGPEGVSEIVTGVVAQGLSILSTLQDNLGSAHRSAEDDRGEPRSLQTNSAPTGLT